MTPRSVIPFRVKKFRQNLTTCSMILRGTAQSQVPRSTILHSQATTFEGKAPHSMILRGA